MTMTMRISEPLIAEFEQEAMATQRLLERVPADKLTWKPHPKSMTLGQLALHVAGVVGDVSGFLEVDGFDVNDANFQPTQPETYEQIMTRFSDAQVEVKNRLSALTDEAATSNWRLTKGDAELWNIPKVALVRSLMFNHLYHHRGQLSVYLRLLDLPVPVTYGRTADENPFA